MIVFLKYKINPKVWKNFGVRFPLGRLICFFVKV